MPPSFYPLTPPQTIENVLIQGVDSVRTLLGTVEIATRLLDLTQNSRNTTIQVILFRLISTFTFLTFQGCEWNGTLPPLQHDLASIQY